MSGREIVVGITGSIGAYKAGDIVRRLREQGCAVSCVLTKEAQQFVAPLTLQALTERKVYTDLFSLEDPHIVHTQLADRASLVLVAPATANVLAKLAHGLADDLLTCVVLATKAPVLIAPAMNVHMYHHPSTQDNIKQLRRFGYRFVGPTVGPLACGYDAVGHLAEVDDIVQAALQVAKPLASSAVRSEPSAPAPRLRVHGSSRARHVKAPARRATRRR